MTKKRFAKKVFLVGLFLISIYNVFFTKNALALFQPEYQNRGLTTFFDGYIPPGSYFQVYFLHFKSNELRLGSKEAPGRFKLSVNTALYQFAYVSEKKVLGGHWGGEIIMPLTNGHMTAFGTRDKDHGVGDIFVAGFFQSDKKTLCLGNYQIPSYFRLLAGVFSPSGDYDHDKIFNVGNNLYTFPLYCASTFFLTPKWELSLRIAYNFHTTNTEFGPDQDNVRPGQLFSMNFATSYQVRESIRLGVAGNYWRQTTDDKLNSHNLRGRELAICVGPGIMLDKVIAKKKVFLMCHSLFDASVKNRPEGTMLQARLIIEF
ncbi:MAG: transporter [Thermodesulfobacteriota bacterium]|jgi:anthranilate 1,2-dioxygenase (deaminating, decarboxylating) large subunit|nr:MAG: transporter [Thermodesulfobacteriota bacterium]